jgi:hypothetical protein
VGVQIQFLAICIEKAVPKDPKIAFLWKVEKKYVIVVEQVIGEEKYDCVMLNVVWINWSIWVGSI